MFWFCHMFGRVGFNIDDVGALMFQIKQMSPDAENQTTNNTVCMMVTGAYGIIEIKQTFV